MELVEIRDLDGPNLFALEPAIKLEVVVSPGEQIDRRRRGQLATALGRQISSDPQAALRDVIIALHEQVGLTPPDVRIHELDLPSHVAVCYPWQRRQIVLSIAQQAFDLVAGAAPADSSATLTSTGKDVDEDEHPTWVRDGERGMPAAAITGTNGKTTTTRLLAHIVSVAGARVGLSSSSGVYINGEQVIEGDYTGHGGARRVLTDPDVDCAVLETARGGILLRGLGFESNDVGVFLNVSADHLNLHGVTRLETLARVKSTVIRVTRPDGIAVLNADDPLVLAQRYDVRAELVLFSRYSDNPEIMHHLRDGGRAVMVSDGDVVLVHGRTPTTIATLADVPLTYRGTAAHMVENALAAVAAAIGLGVEHERIRIALQSFFPDVEHNAGRLNVFEVDGRTAIIDYAHNESGLTHLFDFAAALFPQSARVTAIVGTAGDRSDSVLIRLGTIAAERASRAILKENPRYHRGREPGEAISLLRQGVGASGAADRLAGAYEREFDAMMAALDSSEPGETILVMCIEDYAEIIDELKRRGARSHSPIQPAGGA